LTVHASAIRLLYEIFCRSRPARNAPADAPVPGIYSILYTAAAAKRLLVEHSGLLGKIRSGSERPKPMPSSLAMIALLVLGHPKRDPDA
jgi:hypothetical protein